MTGLRPMLEIPGRTRPWIMAHRGASEHAPENSAASFALALEHGADLLETDLWFCGDGEIVCVHDRSLRRTTGDRRSVTEVGTAALARLRLHADAEDRYRDERVPSLAELVARTPESVPLVLELKDPRFAEGARLQRMLDVLGARARERRAAVIADSLPLLLRIRELAPGLVTGHIGIRDPFGTPHTDMLGPWWPWLYCNPLYVRRAHARNQRVCPLDPRLHQHLRHYLAIDVDALLTNDPRATREAIERLRAAP
jgi:glycerophosphoryl diester phosphodiesterase